MIRARLVGLGALLLLLGVVAGRRSAAPAALATTVVVFVLALTFGFSAGLALPFGLITGLLCMIPMFGAFIGGILVTVLLAMNSIWAAMVFFVYYLVYMQVEANIITPKVQSKGMHLPALVVLASITVGIYMFGLIGAIVAIPIAGCVKVLLEEYGEVEVEGK